MLCMKYQLNIRGKIIYIGQIYVCITNIVDFIQIILGQHEY